MKWGTEYSKLIKSCKPFITSFCWTLKFSVNKNKLVFVTDGSDIAGGTAKRHRLHPNVTEVGSERASPHSQSQSLQLFGPNVQPRHCVIAHTEGIVTVTPCSRDAETYVNGQRIYETTILQVCK